MSVGLLIVTHNRIGEELLATARGILGICPLHTELLSVHRHEDPAILEQRGRELCERLNGGEGVLILTDAFGSTPSNIAVQIRTTTGSPVVSGINLPMLLRVLNYPELDLGTLQRKALSGGRDGVLLVEGASEASKQHGG